MKAIIQKTMYACGERISLMGYGWNESIARQADFAHCNHGHNPFEEEFENGILIETSEELDAEMQSDDHARIHNAMCSLVIENNKLCFEN